MSCTVVTEPAEDDKTLLILWENEGNISIDEETLEKLSETEATPVSVLRLSTDPSQQELGDGVGNINITVKEVYPDIMARLVDPASDEGHLPDDDTAPSQTMEDILSPDEHATFLSWTVAFDHWYTGEPLPPAPTFLGPLLEPEEGDEPPPLSPLPPVREAPTLTATPTPTPMLSSPRLTTSVAVPPAPAAPTRGRGRGRGRPRKDGSLGPAPRGRGRGQGRGRGARTVSSNPHPLLLQGSRLRPSLVPLVTPLMISSDESELRRSMTFRQAIIPVANGDSRLVALVPVADEPRSEEAKPAEIQPADLRPSVEPEQFLLQEQEVVPASTNHISAIDAGAPSMQDIVKEAQPVPSLEKMRNAVNVDQEQSVLTLPEPQGSGLSESTEVVASPSLEGEAAPVSAAAADSFTHVMQSVMRRRRGGGTGGTRGAGPLKLRDYDSELEDALAFVTADLDRQSPLQVRLSSPPPTTVQEAPEKVLEKAPDVKRPYKRRNLQSGKLPSPPPLAPADDPSRRESKDHLPPKQKPQVNNKTPQPQQARGAALPRTPPTLQLPQKFPTLPALAPAPALGKPTTDSSLKRYPKRENRKAPAYLEKEFDSVLFSTPDIIRSVHSENAREQKALRPEERSNENNLLPAVGQDLVLNSKPAGGSGGEQQGVLRVPEGVATLDGGGVETLGSGVGEKPDGDPPPLLVGLAAPGPSHADILARPGRSQPDTVEPQQVLEPSRGGKRGAKSSSPSLANKKRRKSEGNRKQAKSRGRRQVPESSGEEDEAEGAEEGDGSESEDDPDRLWCLCRKPHNNRFMIRCDGCEDWFHGTCVGVTEAEGHRMENRGIYWSCPKCSEMNKPSPEQTVSTGQAHAQVKAVQAAPTAVKGNQATTPAKAAPTKAAVAPVLVKAVLTSPVPKTVSSVPAKTTQTPTPTKAVQPPKPTKATQPSAPAKQAQSVVLAKPAQSPAPVKPVQSTTPAKPPQSPTPAKPPQSPTPAKPPQSPTLTKAAQSPAPTKSAAPAKPAQSPSPSKTAQAPAAGKTTQAPTVVKVTSGPAQAKAAQAPAQGKAAALTTGAVSTIGKRDQVAGRRQEGVLAQKTAAGGSVRQTVKGKEKEKPERVDEVQVQKSPLVPTTAALFSVADVSTTSAATTPGTSKAQSAPRREVIFKAASSSEVSVRVYDKVTGKVLTGANAPKLAELKTWLEEHPTYEVAQRSLKPLAQSAMKKEQQDMPSPPLEKSPTQKNVAPAVATPSPHKPLQAKPKDGDETVGKQRRESTQERQPALLAKRQKRSGSVPNNKRQSVDTDKDAGGKPVTGKPQSQVASKKEHSPAAAAKVSSSPKKVDPRRSMSSEQDKEEERQQKGAQAGPEPIRHNVCRSLQELLQTRSKECSDLDAKEEDIHKIASSIEEEMYALFRDTGLKYKAKYRSLVFNIKDPKNVTLFRKIVENLVTPYQLVRLTPEELASQELAQWREREAKHQLDMIKKTELDLLNNPKIYVVKTHKGELEIEKEPSEFAGAVAMAEAAVPDAVVSSEEGLGFMEEEVVSAREEGRHEKKEKHRHKDKKKHKKESKHKDREHKEKGDQHKHRDGDHERKKRDEEDRHRHRDDEDKHRHKDKDTDHEKKKSKEKDEHTRHDHEKKKSKDKEEKQKNSEAEHEKKKVKSDEEQNSNKDSDFAKIKYKEKDYHRYRETDKEKKEVISEQVGVKSSIKTESETGTNEYMNAMSNKEVKDYQFFMSASNVDESLENFELKLEESIQAEMKFDNENSTDVLDTVPSSGDAQRGFLSVATPASIQVESELGEESALFDRDSNSSLPAGAAQKGKPDSQASTGIVWSGFINMAGVSNVSTSAKLVYGSGKDLADVLPSSLDVVGRINPDTVWDYVSKVKRSGTKEILVLRLTSHGGEAKVSYCALYKHLHSKNRFGVIGNLPESTRIKDFYIMPLASQSPVPEQLTWLDSQIFEGPRPHILVCMIVRTVARQAVSFLESSQPLPRRAGDTSRGTTPSPDPSLHEPQPQLSDDSEGANSDSSAKHALKVEAYIPKPVDSSKLTWNKLYPSASSNDSYPEISEGYDEATGGLLDGDDDPYSPGEDISESVEKNNETRSSLDLQHTVDELDKIIDKRREEIKTISSAIGLAGTVDVQELETLQLISSIADTTTAAVAAPAADEDEAYSPSYSPPPREPASANSTLPPTILDILRNIPKQGSTSSPSPQKKPKLMDDSIVQSYGDKGNDTDEEVSSHKQDDECYSPSDERYSPSDERFSPVENQYSPSDQCYSPPNAASLTFLSDDVQRSPLKEAYMRGELGTPKEQPPGQPLPPGTDLPTEVLGKGVAPTLDQPLPPGMESEYQSYGTAYPQGAPVMVATGFTAPISPAYMYHTVTPSPALAPIPPMQFVVPPPSYHPATPLYPHGGSVYQDSSMAEHRFSHRRHSKKNVWPRPKDRKKRFGRR